MSQRYLVLDYETRSEADLKKTGAFEYAVHPTTRVLCAAWRVGTKEELRSQLNQKIPASVWSPALPLLNKENRLIDSLLDKKIIILAHNALFEQVITRFVLTKERLTTDKIKLKTLKDLPHDRWMCTAAMAASLALPRNLEKACLALDLPVQKDMDGRKLMLKYSKPRKATKNNSDKWHRKLSDLNRLIAYCQNDVDAETELFLTLPQLNDKERKIWLLDQKINFRGFRADRDLVHKVIKMVGEETVNLDIETHSLSGLSSANQRAGVLSYLEHQCGVKLPDLQSKTVKNALNDELVTGDAKRMLEIRHAISKTSLAKYPAFEMRSRFDGRVRDILMYWGASTGRWTGLGLQPHNFPRGNISDTTLAAEILREGDIELIRLIYGDPMNVFSSCLRAVIIPSDGKELYCGDWAAIEARVLFWIAKHQEGIKAFREDRPMYEEEAQGIYNVNHLENVTKLQRQVGKFAFLGFGFQMGWEKFIKSCDNYGVKIDEPLARTACQNYRTRHYPVVKLWSNIERAAIQATLRPGTKFTINYTTWWVEDEFLWCELPSGRKLAYYGAAVKYESPKWGGDLRPKLYHWGVNPLTKKWEFSGTYGGKLTENVVQAIARDLMAEAMLRVDEKGYDIAVTIHDEILAENDIGFATKEEFEELLAEVPVWAEGCPVKVEAWIGPRYKKG